MASSEKSVYRPDELARALGEPIRKVYRWLREGRVRSVWHGGQRRIPRDEFNRVTREGTAPPKRVA